MLVPVEPVRSYGPKLPAEVLENTEKVIGIFEDEDVSVVALDTGMCSYGPHVKLNLVVVNVGYWYYNYKRRLGGCGNRPMFLDDVSGSFDAEIRSKELEAKVIDWLLRELQGGKIFVLLDESLSLSYTLSLAEEVKSEIVDRVVNLVDTIMDRSAIPVGVFYTRACDIHRGILALNPNVDIPRVSDRVIMNRVLKQFERSPVFGVYSKALENKGLRILAFYIKVGEGNVLRVEFPEQLKSFVDEIHLVVLLQSILGGGYPLALQRAHERAVLDANTRDILLDEICRRLGVSTAELIFTRKLISKTWSIE